MKSFIQQKQTPRPRMDDKHPGLFKEINDATSKIPAFARFQNHNNCPLRNDLKEVKANHFAKCYKSNLAQPAKHLSEIQFFGKHLDAGKYYQLKYFLTQDQLKQVYNSKISKDKWKETGARIS